MSFSDEAEEKAEYIDSLLQFGWSTLIGQYREVIFTSKDTEDQARAWVRTIAAMIDENNRRNGR